MNYWVLLMLCSQACVCMSSTCYELEEAAERGALVDGLAVKTVKASPLLADKCVSSLKGILSRSMSVGEFIVLDDVNGVEVTHLQWRAHGNRLQVDMPVERHVKDGDDVVLMNRRSGKNIVVR